MPSGLKVEHLKSGRPLSWCETCGRGLVCGLTSAALLSYWRGGGGVCHQLRNHILLILAALAELRRAFTNSLGVLSALVHHPITLDGGDKSEQLKSESV